MTGVNAIIRALEMTGCQVFEEDYDGFIVSRFKEDIMFSEPQVIKSDIIEHVEVHRSRFDYEKAATKYMLEHDDVVDCRVMFNVAQLFVLNSNRGMLRHVINWPNSSDIKCRWDIIEMEGKE